jgi:hypothetical protein
LYAFTFKNGTIIQTWNIREREKRECERGKILRETGRREKGT